MKLIGILNVTPDSFSDGGEFATTDAAVAHGLALHAAGADYVDVGGESTRPGAERVDAAEECRRVLPVVRRLAAAGVPVSIDTTRVTVAEAALEAGAVLINDVSGGLAEPAMAKLAAVSGVPWILTHWRDHSRHMYAAAHYTDVVTDVAAELAARVDDAVTAGVDPRRLVLDPGLGFAKTAEHNWALLSRLDELVALGLPVLVGASRKAFLGELLAGPEGHRPVHERESATAAISLWAAQAGAWAVRVHDVRNSLDTLATFHALQHSPVSARRNRVS